MAAHHYDLIVIGTGLTEQIAATLLARQGFCVFSLATQPNVEQALPCCSALEGLLAILAADDCPRQSVGSFQWVSDDVRLEFCGARSLEEELRRELPDHHAEALSLLTRLDDWGRRLNRLLVHRAPTAPFHAIRALGFCQRLLSQGLPARRLKQPIARFLATAGHGRLQQLLSPLFSGLSLMAPELLSTAEAALHWHIATRSQTIAGQDLERLLAEHYAAAGGEGLPLTEVATFHHAGKRLQAAILKDGRRLTADQFLIDPLSARSSLRHSLAALLPDPPPAPQHWSVTGLGAQRPPMLARQVILGGAPALRLSWGPPKQPTSQPQVELARAAPTAAFDSDAIHRRLAALLPFSDYRLSEASSSIAAVEGRNTYWPQRYLPCPTGPNIITCPGPCPATSLGASTAIMLGQAAAGTLLRRLGKTAQKRVAKARKPC